MAQACPQQSLVTTSFLLTNLHCPSCVSTIQDTLLALDPRPASISPSLVTSVVAIKHDKSLSERAMRDALESAGFDICDVTPDALSHIANTNGETGYLDRFITRLTSDRSSSQVRQLSKHIENCEACQSESASTRAADSKYRPPVVEDGTTAMAQGGDKTSTSLVVVDSGDSQDIWRASLAIGGMTCASCAGAITKELEKKNWVKKVVVNLISNSATVDFVGHEHKDEVVESIEDIGYDATIDTVVNSDKAKASSPDNTERTVDIRVDGMYCGHCPGRVQNALEAFGDRIKVDKQASMQDPILKATYTPNVPDFTIRNIIAAISSADAAFQPSIYHPPTLEERSRQIHAREQFRILIRVALTLIIAIPTLIVGIIYMSLVSKHNTGRMFLMKPLVAGISRAQWALFIMATPVYFLCADVFHIRALKEIRSMWRPGSTTPYLQRFYKFGSMNMLMSLGTSIAYISSVAQLIAAGVRPSLVPDNNSFYFDSVVFLTLFLLIGRLIEAYSKSRTGDAVTMLGKLRPIEALLVSYGSDRSSTDLLASEEVIKPVNGNGAAGEISNRNIVDRSGPEKLTKIGVDLLELGDIVKVLHGASPPCDGAIVHGQSKFDESSLTGESKLIKKSVGDEVFSGTVNKDSPVSITITGVAGFSMLDQIVKAVREGQTRRAPMERVADKLTSYFVPFVILIAISTWIIWLALGTSGKLPSDFLGTNSGGWVVWSLQFAIAVFVVACPCGLALAAPTAIFVGGGLAANHGILVKGGGEAFEKASRLDCIVFDKTGTLTVGGEPIVTDFEAMPVDSQATTDSKISRQVILGMVAAIEGNSSHTVAKALSAFCRKEDKKDVEADEVEEIAGKGMKGKFQTDATEVAEIIIGNEALLSECSVGVPNSAQATLDEWKVEGRSVALAAIKINSPKAPNDSAAQATWQLAAMFAISDPIRPEAPGIIEALQRRGKDVWMLSGDNQITANAVGAQVGITSSNIIAGVLPSEKAEKIRYLQKSLKARSGSGDESTHERALIAMIGDGINDSPALTTADVGIAIGSGSDIAISSAEFVLVSSNLNALVTLLDLSKFVFRRIKFNFGWALIYNLIALPVAAGVLYPVVSGGSHVRLDPVWASLAMAASSISVVCSSLALRSRIPGIGFRAPRVVEEV